MIRVAGLVFVMAGVLALGPGCGDDDPRTKFDLSVDSGGKTPDTGGTTGDSATDTGTDTAPPKPGEFGDTCAKKADCKTNMTCAITQKGATKGFCSKTCTTATQPCTGSPTGTKSFCLLSAGSLNYCVFLCKYKESNVAKTAPCPPQLTCGTTDDPVGSGQYQCIPK